MKRLFLLFLLPVAAASLTLTGCNTTEEMVEEKETAPAGDYPTAERVPDTDDLVFSPFTTEPHYVDVAGLNSGSLAKCPWTEKVFYVP